MAKVIILEEGTVTGTLVLKILVPWTEIFSGKNGPPGPIVLVKWSTPGNLVRVMQIGKAVTLWYI